MSDLLTQEQINELLNQNTSTGESDILSDGGASDSAGRNYDGLSMSVSLLLDQAKSVLLTVMSKNVDFTIDTSAPLNTNAITDKIGDDALGITITFTGGLQGELCALMRKADVALFSDLMMMGDGTAEYTEEHNDAIGELWSQIMGAYTSAVGAKIGSSVSAGSVVVTPFVADSISSTLGSGDMALISMNIAEIGMSPLVILLEDSLSGQLVKSSGIDTTVGGSEESTSGFGALTEGSFSHGSGSFEDSSAPMRMSSGKSSGENVDMLMDIELDVAIELGVAHLSIKKILELAPGSIVELERMAGEPVDLLVNEKVVAKGEVVVVDENFGIRIVSLVSAEDRIKSLR